MITFNQLQAALFDTDAHAALDRLIRAELETGRTTQAIYDELLNHVDGLRALPGYSDELEDPLGDKLDALCGWIYERSTYPDALAPSPITEPHPPTEANGRSSTPSTRSTPKV